MRLTDRVAVVTGGATGSGRATVERFLQEGARVAFCDLNLEAGQALAAPMEGHRRPLFGAVDITNKPQVEAFVQDVLRHYRRIDIWVNNAGITRDALTAKLAEDQFDDVVRINLKGTFLCCQAVFPAMKEQNSGRIINTASVSALGNVGQANYAAAKSGVIGLTKTLALEFARYNITVNAVAPGFTETQMTATIPDKVREMILQKIPFRRMAKPEEIAGVHAFLASDEAAYITGQVFFVDGGLTVGF